MKKMLDIELYNEKNALQNIPNIIRKHNIDNLLIVYDDNTYKAAGKKVEEILHDINIKRFNIGKDQYAYKSLCEQLHTLCKQNNITGILGVGTGTINDICKYTAYLSKIPYIIVATAPSMDGFCSTVAALIDDGFKRTLDAKVPIAVIGEPDILDNAPKELISAGIGDLIGKYICLADWKISSLVTDEVYDEKIAGITSQSVNQAMDSIKDIINNKEGSTLKLMDTLCMSGIAMAMCGSSRPASGAEHHLSHVWEMRFLALNKKQSLHGTKVGISSAIISQIYHKLADIENISHLIKNPPVLNESYLYNSYGKLTDEVINDNYPDPIEKIDHNKLVSNWTEIRKILKAIVQPDKIRQLLKLTGGSIYPSDIGIDNALVFEGVKFCRYLRPRLTMLRISDIIDIDTSKYIQIP